MKSILVASLALVGAGACAVVSRPPASVASVQAYADSARRIERGTRDSIVARLARRVARRGDATLDILLLSAGGQNGAYGAGFLRGWRARTDAPLPRFDLVTGVSTGSLLAPFALLGTPEALDTIAALYRDAADQIAPTVDWFFWLRKTGGVVNPKRFDRTVARLVDDRMRNALQEQFAQDRQVVVASADLDLGTGRSWDLAREMRPSDGLARAQAIFRASSAIPGVFPPVIIDGHPHTDGGVVSTILVPLDFATCQALAEHVRQRGVSAPITVRLWVVVNQGMYAPLRVIDPASRSSVQRRGNGVMYYAREPMHFAALTDLARAVSAGVPGLRVELHVTAVPAELANAPGADALFDKAFMHRLEELGYDRARGAAPWDEVTSAYARPPLTSGP